jgi:hypothetical protein
MASDTLCDFEPQGKPLIRDLPDSATATISWDHVALTRLNRIPGFIRKMVKKRAEAYVLEREESIVEVHHLEELTARRFGNNKPGAKMLIGRTGGAKNRII